MIQLTVLLGVMCLVFSYIGFTRGWNKEIIAMSGIILALFASFQFDDVLTNLLVNFPPEQAFAIRAALFIIVVFFAYQTRAIVGEAATRARGGPGDGRDDLQISILGGLVGAFNGYLIWGTLWYFQHVANYPLSPYISAPLAGTASANFVESLPLFLLAGGPAGEGNLLAAAVIVLFLIVLIVI
jgi:uncharacterized membrane protein required for colicin V production